MLTSIHAYINWRIDVDWNTCGQAAIATLLDFHGTQPWPITRFSDGFWADGDAIDAVSRDGFGPDIVFGWGTSGGRIADAVRAYGLDAKVRALFFQGGWDQAWPQLRESLDRELPVAVLLDLGRLGGPDFVFHWAIAYAYTEDRLNLAACSWNPTPSLEQFRSAWQCDAVFIPLDLKMCGVFVEPRPGANGARFISQSAPSTGPITPGSSTRVSVTMKNTGTTTWRSEDAYSLGSQDPQDNSSWGMSRIGLPGPVGPNQIVTFSWTAVTPPPPRAVFTWRMVRDGVEWFGAMTSKHVVTISESQDCSEIRSRIAGNEREIKDLQADLRAGGGNRQFILKEIGRLRVEIKELQERADRLGCANVA
ncbi:hypothetical protein [Modestobacter altitudinis]|uniref:hypothetical protein n=1 Tax=Modestobacter altitudinis TaxID=2213158 RepID=UPI00110CAA85|nr:hypothetical protein [Modestobacter altitudinis]